MLLINLSMTAVLGCKNGWMSGLWAAHPWRPINPTSDPQKTLFAQVNVSLLYDSLLSNFPLCTFRLPSTNETPVLLSAWQAPTRLGRIVGVLSLFFFVSRLYHHYSLLFNIEQLPFFTLRLHFSDVTPRGNPAGFDQSVQYPQ